MKVYEDLARLKVNEAIQQGLEAQRYAWAKAVRQTGRKGQIAASAQAAGPQPAAGGRALWPSLIRLLAAEGAYLVGAVWSWALARFGAR
jgi:hypothetical protein